MTPVCEFFTRFEPFRRTAVEHVATLLACARPDIDNPVGVTDHVELMLDNEQRIARGFQPVERPQQRLGVGRMQPRGRLVEHIDHTEQIGAHLRGEPQALKLARRERRRAAIQREIAEPEIEQHGEPGDEILRDALRDHRLFRMIDRELPQRRRCSFRIGTREMSANR